ncbi:hypothetical protein B0H19DRAFT_1382691 [Mycena capillaripes]|nr:hypothetical protein B0H19DRAFT_1382691 [Mycena capillaripes]
MHPNTVAENVLGTIGTVCWTAQLVPQVWKSWRDRSTAGLSPWLFLLWGISTGFLGPYTIILDLNIPLILQPQLFGFLALVSWGQCQYYGVGRSRRAAAVMALGVMLIVGGFEAAMVFAVRPGYAAGREAGARGTQFLGIFSAVLISLALLPQYAEIWQHREVVGISMVFMVVDMLGVAFRGVFSGLSLAFKDRFDIIAGITYSLVVVLDGFVVLAALILNPRAKQRRQRETPRSMEEAAGTDIIDATARPSTTAGNPVPRYPRPLHPQVTSPNHPNLFLAHPRPYSPPSEGFWSTKLKKKNLTIDVYTRCFKALDTLDTLLDPGDAVEASLKAFNLDLLAEINASALRTTYASTAAALQPTSSTSSASLRSPVPPVPTRKVDHG